MRAVLTLGALLVGSSRLPGHVALQLPEGLQRLGRTGSTLGVRAVCVVLFGGVGIRRWTLFVPLSFFLSFFLSFSMKGQGLSLYS